MNVREHNFARRARAGNQVIDALRQRRLFIFIRRSRIDDEQFLR
jgi:hypothetical protein